MHISVKYGVSACCIYISDVCLLVAEWVAVVVARGGYQARQFVVVCPG